MIENSQPPSIVLPDQKNYDFAYGQAFKLAGEKLSKLEDLESQCRKSDSICLITDTSRSIALNYLNRIYHVAFPEIQISIPDSAEPVDLKEQILILHYLTRADGIPLSGRLIAYQELKEGAVYFPSFFKRAVKPLIDNFGNKSDDLLAAAGQLGGRKTDLGDSAVTIPAFSRVPITLVIWRGDDEFPPNANILFDSTVLDYLSAEDVNVLCQTISWRLIKMLLSSSNTD